MGIENIRAHAAPEASAAPNPSDIEAILEALKSKGISGEGNAEQILAALAVYQEQNPGVAVDMGNPRANSPEIKKQAMQLWNEKYAESYRVMVDEKSHQDTEGFEASMDTSPSDDLGETIKKVTTH